MTPHYATGSKLLTSHSIPKKKLRIATLLDACGADELEIGIACMGVKERDDIKELLSLGLKARMMTWNRMKMEDLDASLVLRYTSS